MKTNLLTLTLFLSLTIQSAYAQQDKAQEKIMFETRQLANKIGLNEFGILKLKELNIEKQHEIEEIAKVYNYDVALHNAKLDELNQEYDLKLRAFLRLRALEAYLAMKESESNFVALDEEKK